MARKHVMKGSRSQTNLVPGAERDHDGKLVEPILSDTVREGPLWEACKLFFEMEPGILVTINKFTSNKQCLRHRDKNNTS